MYQYVHDMLPLQFNHYFTCMHDTRLHTTRNSTLKALTIERFSTNRGQNFIKYKGATIWLHYQSFEIMNVSYIPTGI